MVAEVAAATQVAPSLATTALVDLDPAQVGQVNPAVLGVASVRQTIRSEDQRGCGWAGTPRSPTYSASEVRGAAAPPAEPAVHRALDRLGRDAPERGWCSSTTRATWSPRPSATTATTTCPSTSRSLAPPARRAVRAHPRLRRAEHRGHLHRPDERSPPDPGRLQLRSLHRRVRPRLPRRAGATTTRPSGWSTATARSWSRSTPASSTSPTSARSAAPEAATGRPLTSPDEREAGQGELRHPPRAPGPDAGQGSPTWGRRGGEPLAEAQGPRQLPLRLPSPRPAGASTWRTTARSSCASTLPEQVREMRLDGPGYARALQALKEEFPYYIRSVEFETLPDWLGHRSLDKGTMRPTRTYRRHAGTDSGPRPPGADQRRPGRGDRPLAAGQPSVAACPPASGASSRPPSRPPSPRAAVSRASHTSRAATTPAASREPVTDPAELAKIPGSSDAARDPRPRARHPRALA